MRFSFIFGRSNSNSGGEKAGDEDLSDRGGYEPGFIPGFVVPLPDFSGVGYRIAKDQSASGADNASELRYNHFSVVMNAERRLAAFTACNIDGSRIKAINRQTKAVTDDPTLQQLDAESFGAESSDAFRPDRRVLDAEQMGRDFYEDQQVPGFDKPTFPGKNASDAKKKAYYRAMNERTARMLQKGHIVLRGDPAWGCQPAWHDPLNVCREACSQRRHDISQRIVETQPYSELEIVAGSIARRANVLVKPIEHEPARTFAPADLLSERGPHPRRSIDPARDDAPAREMLPLSRHFLVEEQQLAGCRERIAQRAVHAL